MLLTAGQREQLARQLERRGVPKLLPVVTTHAAGCFSIVATNDPPHGRVGHHRFGGEPDLPPDFEWPTRSEEPFAGAAAFIGQVRLEALTAHGPLPTKGLLSIFCFGTDAAARPCHVSVHLFRDCSELERREPPEELADPALASLETVAVELVPAIDLDWSALSTEESVKRERGDLLADLKALDLGHPRDAIGQLLGLAVDYHDLDVRLAVVLAAAGKGHVLPMTGLRSMEQHGAALARLEGLLPVVEPGLAHHLERRVARRNPRDDIAWWIENRSRLLSEAKSWQSLLRVDSNDPMDLQINDSDPLFVLAPTDEIQAGTFTHATGRVLQG